MHFAGHCCVLQYKPVGVTKLFPFTLLHLTHTLTTWKLGILRRAIGNRLDWLSIFEITDIAEKALDLDCFPSVPWSQETLRRCGGWLLSPPDLQTAQANCASCHSQLKNSFFGKGVNQEDGKWEKLKARSWLHTQKTPVNLLLNNCLNS